MSTPFDLMRPEEIAADIGKNIRLSRAARNWRQEDLSRESGVSLQAIKNLEAGENIELKTFLKVSIALGVGRAVWESFRPKPQTLDELERIEHARNESSRIRVTG